jgi:hypothetical protein
MMTGQGNKPYANYFERKIDEEREVQKDLFKKGFIGPGIKNLMQDV